MKSGTIDIDQDVFIFHLEVRLADRTPSRIWAYRHLLLNLNAMFLEKTQKLQF
jgi:hypothetical protein